jgi:hypothetical protein
MGGQKGSLKMVYGEDRDVLSAADLAMVKAAREEFAKNKVADTTKEHKKQPPTLESIAEDFGNEPVTMFKIPASKSERTPSKVAGRQDAIMVNIRDFNPDATIMMSSLPESARPAVGQARGVEINPVDQRVRKVASKEPGMSAFAGPREATVQMRAPSLDTVMGVAPHIEKTALMRAPKIESPAQPVVKKSWFKRLFSSK